MLIVQKIARLIRGEIPTKALIKRGMKVGENYSRQSGVFLDPTHCWLIEIGNNVTMSIKVTILAHDSSYKAINGYTKLGRVLIGNNVFIGANSTILPGVTVGDGAIIGASSVVTRDIPAGVVAAGNPARVIRSVEEQKSRLSKDTVFLGEEYTMRENVTPEKKEEMKRLLEDKDVVII